MKPIISEFMWYKKRRFTTEYSRNYDNTYCVCLGHNKYVSIEGTNPNEWIVRYQRYKSEYPDKRYVRVLDKCGIEWFGNSTMDKYMDTKETLSKMILDSNVLRVGNEIR